MVYALFKVQTLCLPNLKLCRIIKKNLEKKVNGIFDLHIKSIYHSNKLIYEINMFYL